MYTRDTFGNFDPGYRQSEGLLESMVQNRGASKMKKALSNISSSGGVSSSEDSSKFGSNKNNSHKKFARKSQ